MTMKFGRRYELTVQGNDGKLRTITMPLTCKFTIERHNFAMANSASFSLYGLSEANRKNIYYDFVSQPGPIPLTFKAGYANSTNLPVIFNGNVKNAYTTREGPELVTHITGLDGGFQINDSQYSDTRNVLDFKSEMLYLMTKLVGLKQPGIVLLKSFPPTATSPVTYNGSVWNELQKYAAGVNASLFIDNERAVMLGPGKTLTSSGIKKISSSSGLLKIPQKTGPTVTVDMLFEPGIIVGQALELDSDLASWVNRTYTVIGLKHSGTISEVESGDARTTVTMFSEQQN